MKNLENIDDLFSSSLENFEVTPPKEAKKAIEQTLHKQTTKRNKKGGWLLLSFISLSIITTAMFVQNKNNKKQNVTFEKSLVIDLKSENRNDAEAETAKTNTLNVSKKKTNKSDDLIILSGKRIDGIQSKLVSQPTNLRHASSLKTQHQEQNAQVKLASSNIRQPQLMAQNETIKQSEEVLSNSNVFVEASSHDALLAQNLTIETPNSQISNSSNKENLDSDNLQPNDVNKDSAIAELNPFSVPEKIDEPKPASTNFFIAFNLGTGFNTNQYSKNNAITAQELKDSIVFNKPYLNAQLLCGVNYNKLSISTGIAIYKLNDKVKYSYINQKMERILVDSIYIDPITNDTIVKHNVPVDTLMNYYTSNTQQSTHTILQIPFLATYKYALAQRLQLDISAGGALNILIKSKGNYKESTIGTITEYKSKSNTPLKTFNFNAQAIIGLSYDINDRTSMQFALPFQIGLGNFYTKDYFINRRVNSAGVQFGLKYNF